MNQSLWALPFHVSQCAQPLLLKKYPWPILGLSGSQWYLPRNVQLSCDVRKSLPGLLIRFKFSWQIFFVLWDGNSSFGYRAAHRFPSLVHPHLMLHQASSLCKNWAYSMVSALLFACFFSKYFRQSLESFPGTCLKFNFFSLCPLDLPWGIISSACSHAFEILWIVVASSSSHLWRGVQSN